MSAITTHVLDVARGRPAANIPVLLEIQESSAAEWRPIGRGTTDADGRLRSLLPDGDPLLVGVYRLVFNTAQYFANAGVDAFYPRVIIEFETAPAEAHYHVPLLLSPFGYSTYRGT
ncbi:MAG: hydroxyisourate hydrolase [Vicinamibacterales bacterium]